MLFQISYFLRQASIVLQLIYASLGTPASRLMPHSFRFWPCSGHMILARPFKAGNNGPNRIRRVGSEKKSEAPMRSQAFRPEGPTVNRPGRKAGNAIEATMSAKGAALRCLCRPFGPHSQYAIAPPDTRGYSLPALRASTAIYSHDRSDG